MSETDSLLGDFKPAGNIGGGKHIDFLGGVALLTNSLTGPGLVTIPLLFSTAGWVPCLVAMLLCMVMSSLASTMLCETMSKYPGNDKFQGRIEFSTLARYLMPKIGYVITILLLILSLTSQLVSSIIVSAQTMDLALIAISGHTYGIEFYPKFGIAHATTPGNEFGPFGNIYVLSLGFVITFAVCIPLGYFNLDDNIIIQKGAIICLLLIFVEWFVSFFVVGLDFSRIPAVGDNLDQVLGTIIFNYAFVITVPSWVNEKKDSVSINKSVWLSTVMATVFYLSIGFFGGWAFNFRKHPDADILDMINTGTSNKKVLHVLSQICVYAFPAVALMSSIPVFSIIIRYNLVENDICRKPMANFWSILVPWLISVVFYSGAGILEVINWTSLFVNGFINFVIPMVLYLIALRKEKLLNRLNTVQDGIEDLVDDDFQAVPHSWSPKILAVSLITLTTILCLAVIAFNLADLA